MGNITDYRIVQKPFNIDGGIRLRPNQPVDVSGWRNLKGLESGRYLRRPITEDDYELINAAMAQSEEPIEEPKEEPIEEPTEEPTPKRGRPCNEGR